MLRARALTRRGMILSAMVASLASCGRGESTSSSLPAEVHPASSAPEVTLSPGQAKVVRVETARMEQFPLERDLTGSIGYIDDPNLIQAESTLLGAAATYHLTQKELKRVNDLGDTNGIARKEMEQAVSDAQTAQATLKAARDAVTALGKSDAEIDRMVATGRIDSPFAGRAVKWAVGNVVESESALFHGGQAVRLRVPSYPDRWFGGTVTELYSSVDPSSHRLTLRARISDPQNQLRPGMLADLVVETQKPVMSVGIAESGVVREGDGTMTVWTTTDYRHFLQRVVTTGMRAGGNVQIVKGLNPGDRVVSDGAIYLDNMLNAAPSD